MPLTAVLQRLEHLDRMIRFKNTGSPVELAEKLGVSESTLFQCLKEMKEELKMPIEYDASRQSYVYTEEGKLFMGFLRKLPPDEMANVRGGISLFQKLNINLTSLRYYRSEPPYLCPVKTNFLPLNIF